MEESRFEDTPIVFLLRLLADLMGLQLLFLLFCIPVVTIGPALSAMYAVLFKRERDGGTVSVISSFFHALRKNFLSALALEGIVVVIAGVACGDLWFATHSQPPLRTVYLAVATIIGIVALVLFILAFAQQSVFQNTIRNYLKNSFSLAVCAPLHLIASLTAWALPWVLIAVEPEVLTYLGVFHLLWGFSLPAWATVKLLEKVFIKTKQDPDSQSDL